MEDRRDAPRIAANRVAMQFAILFDVMQPTPFCHRIIQIQNGL